MNINRLYKKAELLANLAIVLLAAMLGTVVVKNYFLPSRQPVAATENGALQHGKKLPLPEVDWKKNGRTLVIAISSTCPYCSASIPFYRQVSKERGDTHLVVVMPQPINEGQQYLSGLGVSVDEVKQASFNAVGVRGTPTLVLVDDTGTIMNSWMGKLPEAQESEVLSQLHAPAPHVDAK